jgi:glycosyltransferase involved in cell wall biosynthesis
MAELGTKMKIVHFNTFEGGGGAAKASLALHRAMLNLGIDATLIVHRKTSFDTSVIGLAPAKGGLFNKKLIPRFLSAIHYVLYRPLETWSFGLFGNKSIAQHGKVKGADIISLSWVSWFLDIDAIAELLKQNKPVVWTCYDMWAFTGGCHYAGDCDHFTKNCGSCPQLGHANGWDISEWLWKKKKKCWDVSRLTIVCPSQWLAESVRKSGLLRNVRIEVIPSGIDISVFHPMSKVDARNILGLPLEKKLILFIASRGFANERKGGKLLEKSLHVLHDTCQGDLPDVVILGHRQGASAAQEKFTIHSREFNDDVSLAHIYAACDVLVAPSKADTLPLTVLQSMACGTPCVAFNVGGMGDVIEHSSSGYLALPFDIVDFARGIAFVLEDGSRHESLSCKCVNKIHSGFTSINEARQYIQLFEKLLSC